VIPLYCYLVDYVNQKNKFIVAKLHFAPVYIDLKNEDCSMRRGVECRHPNICMHCRGKNGGVCLDFRKGKRAEFKMPQMWQKKLAQFFGHLNVIGSSLWGLQVADINPGRVVVHKSYSQSS